MMTPTNCGSLTFLALAVLVPTLLSGQNQQDLLLREIYQELVEIDTSPSEGTALAAETLAARLRGAGFPEEDVQVLGSSSERSNLVARMRGSGAQRPIVLLGHLDVVEALREDWSYDPFTLNEIDGYFYGRGTLDDKAMCAIWIANLIRLKREGWVPDRDIIVALTAGEEEGAGPGNGAQWLLANHPDLVDGRICPERGRGQPDQGWRVPGQHGPGQREGVPELQPRGHEHGRSQLAPHQGQCDLSSRGGTDPFGPTRVPRRLERNNPRILRADVRAGTRADGFGYAELDSAESASEAAVQRLSAIAVYNARMRTTCVATQLEAGHAENALPQTARATVNCRVLPGLPVEEVQATLVRVLNDPEITVTAVAEATVSPPSPLTPEVIGSIRRLTEEFWPGVPMVPEMSAGATDGLFFRNAGIPVYGVDGLFVDMNDNRMHGMDERVGVRQLWESREFLYRFGEGVGDFDSGVTGEREYPAAVLCRYVLPRAYVVHFADRT